MTEYKIISALLLEDLTADVQKALNEGFRLAGGLAAAHDPKAYKPYDKLYPNGAVVWVQALVRDGNTE